MEELLVETWICVFLIIAIIVIITDAANVTATTAATNVVIFVTGVIVTIGCVPVGS